MEYFVLSLCQVTFFSSVTVGLLLLVKRLCKFHISPRLHVALWLILFIRILVPSLPESVHSVYNYVPGYERVADSTTLHSELYPQEIEYTNRDTYLNRLTEEAVPQTPLTTTETTPAVSEISAVKPAETDKWSDIASFIVVIYTAGVAVCFVRMLVSYHTLYAKTLRTSVPCDNRIWCDHYMQIAREMHCRPHSLPALYVGTAPSMLIGILKPILLVNAHTDENDLPMVFAHELNHHKYRDNFLIFLSNMLAAFMWFNPLIWMACRCIRDDLEVLCDSRTVQLPSINTRAYAVLLYQSTYPGVIHTVHVATGISTESVLLKKRLKRLAGDAPSGFSRILSGVVCTVLIVGCLTNPVHSLVADNDVYVQNGTLLVGSEFVSCDPDEGISGTRFYNIVYTTLKNKTGGKTSPIPLYLGDGTLTDLTRHAIQAGIADGPLEADILEISHSNAITYEQAAILLDAVIRLIDHSPDVEYGASIPLQISENSLVRILQQLPDDEARALLSCYNRGNSNSTIDFSIYYTEEEINEISSRIANDWLREKFLIFYHRVPLSQLPDGFCAENGIVTESDAIYKLYDSLSEGEIQIVRDIVSIAKTGDCEDVFYLKGRCDVYSEAYMSALYEKVGYTRSDIHQEYAALGVSGYSAETGIINWIPYRSEIRLKNHGSSPEATFAVLSVCSYGIMSPNNSYFPYNQPLCFGEAMRTLCLLYAGMES